jgi:hypothetical protein
MNTGRNDLCGGRTDKMNELLKSNLSDMQLRAMLEEMILHNLLGPAGDSEEGIAWWTI